MRASAGISAYRSRTGRKSLCDCAELILSRNTAVWAASFAAGVYGYLRVDALSVLIASILVTAAFFLITCSEGRLRPHLVCILLIPVMTLLGYLRTVPAACVGDLQAYERTATDCDVTGIAEDVRMTDYGGAVILRDAEVRTDVRTYTDERIRLCIRDADVYGIRIGGRIYAEGRLYPSAAATSEGQFDSLEYYGARGISASLYTDGISVEAVSLSNDRQVWERICDRLANIRYRTLLALRSVLPREESSVLWAMMTGDRGLMSEETTELYKNAGISHIISISALHLTLIGMLLYGLLFRLTGSLRVSSAVSLLLLCIYTVMTGASVPAQRALVMTGIMLTARVIGRVYDVPDACGGALLIILIIQPLYICDSGALLSFLAVLGVAASGTVTVCCGIRNRMLTKCVTGLGLQLFIMPVLMSMNYFVTPYSLLLNLIVLPCVPVLLVSGIMAAAAAGLSVTVGRLFAGPAYFILRSVGAACRLELELPYARILTGAPCKPCVMAYYVILAVTLVLVVMTGRRRVLPALLCLLVIFAGRPLPALSVDVLDVGQGKCIIVRAGHNTVMADCGSTGITDVYDKRLKPYLMYNAIDRLDKIFLTHDDTDHTSGITDLITSGYFDVGELVCSDMMPGDSKTLSAAALAGIPVRRVSSGERVAEYSDVSVICISPIDDAIYSSDNSSSLVLLLQCGGFSMLITGDSDTGSERVYVTGLEEILAGEALNVLDVAHHGSKYSTSAELLTGICPQVAVISCGAVNPYGHPAEELMERLLQSGAEVYTTPDHGSVRIIYDGGDKYKLTYHSV